MPPTREQDQGRSELLNAAGEVFAEVGFRQATIRQIVDRAGASVGAVNYHFGDKRRLYREVLAYAHRHTIEQFREAAGDPDPQQRLVRYVRTLLSHVLGERAASWPGRILCNELSELISQDARGKRELLRRYIQPRMEILSRIVRDLLGSAASEEVVARHAVSVGGQCTYYFRSRPAAEAAFGRTLGEADLQPLTDHIARIALAGIEAEREATPPPSPGQQTKKKDPVP